MSGGSDLGALYPAVAAVLVALIGLVGTLLSRRGREPKVDTSEKQDSNVLLKTVQTLTLELDDARRAEARQRARAERCESRLSARDEGTP